MRDAGPILQAANNSVSSRPSGSAWPSAEEEKARLFNQAKEAVRKTQGVVDEPDGAGQGSNTHDRSGSVNSGPQSSISAGAAMYSQALNSMSRNPSTGQPTPASPAKRSYPTAEEEKAALHRYQQATAAVARNQAAAYGAMPSVPEQSPPVSSPPPMTSPVASPKPNPQSQNGPPLIPYDTLYPNSARMASPPPGAGGSQQSQPSYLTEKEKLRRMYEAQDAAALAAQQQAASPPPPSIDAPAYMPPTSPMPYTNGNSAFSEKEMLRRRYEAQDAAALAGAPPPATPPRATSSHGRSLPTPRAQPTPPPGPSGSRPLTAAEEKARLRAMYEAEERGMASPPPPQVYSPPPMQTPNGANGHNGVNGYGYAANMERQTSVSSGSHYSDIPPPPPLMPKPPREYMEETLHEDRVLSTQIQSIDKQHEEGFTPRVDTNLELRPFTPFNAAFDSHAIPLSVPPPPPLPPKVGLDSP